MRPVNKGESPYQTITDYKKALPYLEKRIGSYCSYCEMPIFHVPEVEHMVSKSKGGDVTAWSNLLLGCKYCNSRKSTETTPLNVEEYLWPDTDNTALVFSYEEGVPQIDGEKLLKVDPTGTAYRKADNLFSLVKLNQTPDKNEKDKRWLRRNEAWQTAKDSLESWKNIKSAPAEYRNVYKWQMLQTAIYGGFFSVWMSVFADESEILLELIENFPGTQKRFFDENGKVKEILE